MDTKDTLKKVLFVYDMETAQVPLWKDGLSAALEILKQDFNITYCNLYETPRDLVKEAYTSGELYDFVLGWGAWGSKVDLSIRNMPWKKGLCIGGNARFPEEMEKYNVLFYETDWYLPQIASHRNLIHAFGVNTDIYRPIEDALPLWDVTTVGAFANWKRQERLLLKDGYKLAIGQIQKDNLLESMSIISKLLSGGVCISDSVEPARLAWIYASSSKVFIPADINGGGERAVLEARACGVDVEVEFDNPKLKELLKTPVYDHHYYADQLRKGIESCL